MKRSLYLLAGVLAASLMGSSCGSGAQKKQQQRVKNKLCLFVWTLLRWNVTE